MRYTLRLLTTQQFARAASLICAAESIRLIPGDVPLLDSNSEPFSVGLWVGPLTPGTLEDAAKQLQTEQASHRDCARNCATSQRARASTVARASVTHATLLPLTACPWCGATLCADDLSIDISHFGLVTNCPNAACLFSVGDREGRKSGIPLVFIDDEIYRTCPTVLVATIDKFATLPFRGDAKALFGYVNGRCTGCGFTTDAASHRKHPGTAVVPVSANDPIDLIIQDELHTINDTIGSIYGLYETAVEYLATRASHAPKYVAATATVKNVETQISRLYCNRAASVFPPTGLEAGDTFFSRESVPDKENPGRLYVGVYAPTVSRLSTFVSVLSTVLAAGLGNIKQGNWERADPYMTVVGYFNTIRDLGGIKALLGDDIPPRLKTLAERNDWPVRILRDWEDELTGRIESSHVPERLERLAKKFTAQSFGVDVMACTNMISVGVDVSRLGLMVVDGQPKTTAEYIQATSRVGRRSDAPGLVLMVYNAMRPRDVSHYEHFYHYHDTYYRYVEAGSITPFSDGAITRYLASAYIAAYRLSGAKSRNEDASTEAVSVDRRLELDDVFLNRVSMFGPHERASVQAHLEQLGELWAAADNSLRYAYGGGRFGSSRPRSSNPTYIIRAADTDVPAGVQAWYTAPRSMRNVEAEVPLRLDVDV